MKNSAYDTITNNIYISPVFYKLLTTIKLTQSQFYVMPSLISRQGVEPFPLKETCIKSPVLHPLLSSFVLGRSQNQQAVAGSTYLEKEKGAPSSFFFIQLRRCEGASQTDRGRLSAGGTRRQRDARDDGAGLGEGVESKGVIWVAEDRSTNINIRLLVNASGSYWRYVSQ